MNILMDDPLSVRLKVPFVLLTYHQYQTAHNSKTAHNLAQAERTIERIRIRLYLQLAWVML